MYIFYIHILYTHINVNYALAAHPATNDNDDADADDGNVLIRQMVLPTTRYRNPAKTLCTTRRRMHARFLPFEYVLWVHVFRFGDRACLACACFVWFCSVVLCSLVLRCIVFGCVHLPATAIKHFSTSNKIEEESRSTDAVLALASRRVRATRNPTQRAHAEIQRIRTNIFKTFAFVRLWTCECRWGILIRVFKIYHCIGKGSVFFDSFYQ